MKLPEKLIALHEALERGRIPHAYGGAIALAYWTLDPRATNDIDVNVFLPSSDPGPALAALPADVDQPTGTAEAIARDGQVRLWWTDTPVDLFFDYAQLHRDAARHVHTVPFGETEIPVLGPLELAAFKVVFDRTRDWADIEAMLTAGTLDLEELRTVLKGMIDEGDPRFSRLAEAARRAAPPDPA